MIIQRFHTQLWFWNTCNRQHTLQNLPYKIFRAQSIKLHNHSQNIAAKNPPWKGSLTCVMLITYWQESMNQKKQSDFLDWDTISRCRLGGSASFTKASTRGWRWPRCSWCRSFKWPSPRSARLPSNFSNPPHHQCQITGRSQVWEISVPEKSLGAIVSRFSCNLRKCLRAYNVEILFLY